ncbi:MAG: LysM peptidoglycan-binding domain-containing protein, partial [Candidatus Obscuribacterales bacterium]|nr:LysM peptidoglycan-binding domain-containing protein [Candidatus Obscuribacterales bacterium]
KPVSEIASAQKVQDAGVKAAGELTTKSADAVVRTNEMSIKVQDTLANNAQTGDRNVRLSDAIVRAAEQAIIKGSESSQPLKLDGNARVFEQNIQLNANQSNALIQGNQMIANGQQQTRNDAVRNDANAINKGEQNQIAQSQLGNQQQLAQPNIMIARNSDQVAAHGVKANPDCPTPAQKNVDIKVDQVVADILNHVRHNSKDQQAGAKILSSLDQANIAANQQQDPRALLDAAAVRRILDGQGISLSPSALNTLMEGIQPTGEHAADYALPSIGSLSLSQIIGLGERLQEAVSGAGSETSEPQPKPQLQQHRTKYLVKEGDTLESIAQEKLGDARLVQLLITINRAVVNYRLEGEKKVAYVVANQYMWLPTDHELEVHKRNFFGKHGKDGSVALAINSKQNTPLIPPVSFDHTIEVSAEVSASMQDFRPASSPSNPISNNRMSAGYEVKKVVPNAGSLSRPDSGSESETGSKMAGNLDRLRHAGDRKSVNLDQIEFASTQVSHRQCYQVREGESLMSIAASLESMGHISMWKLLAKINGFQIEEGGLGKPVEKLHEGQFIVLPTTEELNEYKLLEKLTSTSKAAASSAGVAQNAFACVVQQRQIETPPPPALVALAQGVGGLTTVQKLSNFTRLVFNDLPQLENCFSITVEARWNGQWKPMASYECRHGQTTRHLYNKHGEIKSMELDLPPYVVKEMAREDFVRNWNAYVNCFMGNAANV